MSLVLSDADLVQLERALTTALSPLDHERVELWGTALMAAWRPLLAADQAIFGHSLDGTVVTQGDGPFMEDAARTYAEYFWTVDPGVTQTRKALELEVYHRNEVYSWDWLKRSEIFNDWAVPRRLHDVLALNIETGDKIPAAAHFYHDREYGGTFGERGLALLRILLPAFKAGVATHQRLAAHRSQLSNVFDAATEGYALFDLGGRQLHENPALERILAAEPERERLRASVCTLAAGFAALARRNRPRVAPGVTDIAPGTFREIQTGRGHYRIRATLISAGLLSNDASVLIALEVPERKPLSDEELRQRYMLTAREVEVARLLAVGKQTSEVAEALGVSTHTARHHTEHVLAKLGVKTRAAVAALLLADA
jgi:DNA-binding CsgD family transcriptional regulator